MAPTVDPWLNFLAECFQADLGTALCGPSLHEEPKPDGPDPFTLGPV